MVLALPTRRAAATRVAGEEMGVHTTKRWLVKWVRRLRLTSL